LRRVAGVVQALGDRDLRVVTLLIATDIVSPRTLLTRLWLICGLIALAPAPVAAQICGDDRQATCASGASAPATEGKAAVEKRVGATARVSSPILTIHASNPSGGQPVDLYVGALWPDGNTIVFLVAPNVFGGLGQYSAPASVAPMLVLDGGATVNTVVLEYTFPSDGIPIGTYNVFAALFRQGSLADNVLGDGDLIWVDFFPLAYAP
jgi:hypothetical protein